MSTSRAAKLVFSVLVAATYFQSPTLSWARSISVSTNDPNPRTLPQTSELPQEKPPPKPKYFPGRDTVFTEDQMKRLVADKTDCDDLDNDDALPYLGPDMTGDGKEDPAGTAEDPNDYGAKIFCRARLVTDRVVLLQQIATGMHPKLDVTKISPYALNKLIANDQEILRHELTEITNEGRFNSIILRLGILTYVMPESWKPLWPIFVDVAEVVAISRKSEIGGVNVGRMLEVSSDWMGVVIVAGIATHFLSFRGGKPLAELWEYLSPSRRLIQGTRRLGNWWSSLTKAKGISRDVSAQVSAEAKVAEMSRDALDAARYEAFLARSATQSGGDRLVGWIEKPVNALTRMFEKRSYRVIAGDAFLLGAGYSVLTEWVPNLWTDRDDWVRMDPMKALYQAQGLAVVILAAESEARAAQLAAMDPSTLREELDEARANHRDLVRKYKEKSSQEPEYQALTKRIEDLRKTVTDHQNFLEDVEARNSILNELANTFSAKRPIYDGPVDPKTGKCTVEGICLSPELWKNVLNAHGASKVTIAHLMPSQLAIQSITANITNISTPLARVEVLIKQQKDFEARAANSQPVPENDPTPKAGDTGNAPDTGDAPKTDDIGNTDADKTDSTKGADQPAPAPENKGEESPPTTAPTVDVPTNPQLDESTLSAIHEMAMKLLRRAVSVW